MHDIPHICNNCIGIFIIGYLHYAFQMQQFFFMSLGLYTLNKELFIYFGIETNV